MSDSQERSEARSWIEEKRFRENLHPLLHFSLRTTKKTPLDVLMSYSRTDGLFSGGIQRKNLSDDELINLSEWLYELDKKGDDSVINVFGFYFKDPQDAMYYKLKWC